MKQKRNRSFPINIRTYPEIGVHLQIAAERAGLTMTQEVERRLRLCMLLDSEQVETLLHFADIIRAMKMLDTPPTPC